MRFLSDEGCLAFIRWQRQLIFAVGLLLTVLGCFITFLPGTEQYWFSFAAAWVSAGWTLRARWIRVATSILVLFGIFAAFEGRQTGRRYREHLGTELLASKRTLEDCAAARR